MSYGGICHFCDQPVDTTFGACYRISGWEATRDQGGANRIIDRERDADVIAHTRCAERSADLKRRGIAAEQTSLL